MRVQPKLHEAIRSVLLREPGNQATTTRIAEANKQQDLYRRRDGLHPAASQISARLKTHKKWFKREGDIIRYIGPA